MKVIVDTSVWSLYFRRTKGIQGSFIDYLICAQAVNGKMSILTTDQDFQNYSDCLGLQIWNNRAG